LVNANRIVNDQLDITTSVSFMPDLVQTAKSSFNGAISGATIVSKSANILTQFFIDSL